MPIVGDQVVIIFTEDGEGICLNGYYHQNNRPEEYSKYSYFKRLSKDILIGVDQAAGDLIVIAKKIKLENKITIEGDIDFVGQTTFDGNMMLKGTIEIKGDLNVSGTITAGGRSL